MQLRGLIKLFTIALILISLFQLSFTFVVRNFEKKQEAKVLAQIKAENPNMSAEEQHFAVNERVRPMLDSMAATTVYNLGFTKYSYQEAKEQELNLGLDLQGGMNVVLEVSLDDLVRSMSNNPKDPALNAAIAEANRMKANSQADFISLFSDAYLKANPSAKLANLFAKSGNKDIDFGSSNDQVIKVMRSESRDAIKRTYSVLLTRIDKFGVAQPNVNLDENRGIISVELAGVNNPERVRKYLQATAKLEFWETYPQHIISQNILDADVELKNYLAGVKTKDTTAVKDSSAVAMSDSNQVKKGDTTSLSSLMKADTAKKDTSTAGLTDAQKLEKARKENPLRYFLIGGFDVRTNPKTGEVVNESRVSYIKVSDTAQLNKYLALDVVKNKFPKDLKFYYGNADKAVNEQAKEKLCVLYAIKKRPGTDEPKLGGETIIDTRQDYDQLTGQPDVQMTMNSIGARAWEIMTGDNVGKPIAIVLDDVVYSAPAPSEKIGGGRSNITGSFTVEEAQDLANILKTGKLPAPAKIVQEQVVGPTLGQEAVNGGMISFVIAFLVIFILMLVYYNTAGWVANIALILNLLFTVGVLAALHASLTAAGIAGLVLTIGMAVDTNVIIFERIKEELKLGKKHEQAVNDGYRRSLSPVLDGHITILMTAIILFIFGLGPVLGFATTQILGILLSLFCGILVSRLITDIRMNGGNHFNYFTKLSEGMFQRFNFHFIEWRKKAYVISVIVLIMGIASLFNGFDYGVEFAGGRSYTVRLDKNVKTGEIREQLKPSFNEYPIVKTIGTANQVNITTSYKIKDVANTVEQEVQGKLYEGLKAGGYIKGNITETEFKDSYIMSSQTVLPTISDDLKKGALWATFWSLLLISIYIFVRFRKWQYAAGTIVALLHDVLVTLAVFSFLRRVVPFALEIDQHFIAAVLTVIGFSMNDTVIVFDRIREYFRKKVGMSKTDVINSAINDTMSRTIMTSLTVFITLLILFIFGGEVTRGFAFAMMIGVVTGTYSSIFVAAPILVDMDKSDKLTMEEDKDLRIEELKKMA